MTERRLTNTIFLIYLVTENYCQAHHLTSKEFLQLNKQYPIIEYVAECPDVFDSMMTGDEMVREIDELLSYHRPTGN